jgi:hypothetical protein
MPERYPEGGPIPTTHTHVAQIKLSRPGFVHHPGACGWSCTSICRRNYSTLELQPLLTLHASVRNSSVGTATHYGLENPAPEYRWKRDFPDPPRPAPLYNGYPVSFLEGKRPGHRSDHPPHSSAEVENGWSYNPTPPLCLVCNGTALFLPPVCFHGIGRDNSTFYLTILEHYSVVEHYDIRWTEKDLKGRSLCLIDVLSYHLPARTGKRHEKATFSTRSRFEPRNSWIEVLWVTAIPVHKIRRV